MSYTKASPLINLEEGNGININETIPIAPIISVDTAELPFVLGVIAGPGISINNTVPSTPIISVTSGGSIPSWQDTLNAGSDLTTDNVVHQDGFSTSFLSSGSLLTFGGGTAPFNIFQVSMVDGTANTWSDIYNTVNQLRLTVRDSTNYDRRIRIDTNEILFKSNIFRFDTTDYSTGAGYVWTDVAGTGVMTLRPPSGGGTTETASNGLTKTVNDIQLGGLLVKNTIVDVTSLYNLTLAGQGTGYNIPQFRVNSTGVGGLGMSIDSYGRGLNITTNTNDYNGLTVDVRGAGIAGYFFASSGVGLFSQTGTGTAGVFLNSLPAALSTHDVADFSRQNSSGTSVNGQGARINFKLTDAGGSTGYVNRMNWSWVNATSGPTRESEWFIDGGYGLVTVNKLLSLRTRGSAQLPKYGIGTWTGTPTYALQVDASGNIIEGSLAGGADTTTASNGLTETGDNIQLGGTLTQNTIITEGNFGLSLSNSPTSTQDVLSLNVAVNRGIFIQNNGNDPGIYVTGGNAIAIRGFSTANTAIFGVSTNYAGLQSTGVYGAILSTNVATDNTVIPNVQLHRSVGTVGADGIGQSIDFYAQSGADNLANQIISKWTTADSLTRKSEFSITGVHNTVTNVLLRMSGAGIFTLVQGLLNFTDDTTAAAGGIPLNGLYRTASAVKIRVV